MPSMTGRCRGKPRLKVLLFGWQNPRSYGGIQSFVRDLRLASPAHLAFHVFPEDLFDCAFEVARGRFRRGKFVKRLAACPASTIFSGRRQLFFPIDDNYFRRSLPL